VRTLCYGSQLAGGVLCQKASGRSELGKSLLVFSAQLSQCRTVLRLFDDLSMYAYSRDYGLGAKAPNGMMNRQQLCSEVFSILSSMADFANAVNWMPPGFLWAGKFPDWLVGLLGTTSSLIGLYQMCSGGSGGSV
ncbi:UNVERIFIED_CONTAM: hypothetical protein FKN15_023770, partial [Acipenser sinensis]